jgi:hypothetical protein
MGLWDGVEVISSYTDKQAVADGVLVDLPAAGIEVEYNGRRIDRCTIALWGAFERTAQSIAALLEALCGEAVDTAGPGEDRDYMYRLPDIEGARVWLVENGELGGSWTVMFASDY